MKAYDNLAPYYDEFMGFMEYDDEAKDLHCLFNNVEAKSILDLGAGSGGHLIPLLRNGHQVDAMDISKPMLDVLAGKLSYQGLKTHLYEGDMCSYVTEKQYHAAYALGDTIHHLPNTQALQKFLENAYNNLKPGGYLVFSWRHADYFKDIASLESFYEEHGDHYLLWNITADEENNLVTIAYTAFISRGEDAFHRIKEEHSLQIYEEKDVEQIISNTGFTERKDLASSYLCKDEDEDEFKRITVLQKR